MKKYAFILVAILVFLLAKRRISPPKPTIHTEQGSLTESTKHVDVTSAPNEVSAMKESTVSGDATVPIESTIPVEDRIPVEVDNHPNEAVSAAPLTKASSLTKESSIGLEKLVMDFANEDEKVAYLDKLTLKTPQESFDRGSVLPSPSIIGVYRGKIQSEKIYNIEVNFGSNREINVVINEEGTPSKFGFSRDLDKSARIVKDGETYSILIDFLKRNLTINKNMIQIIFTDPSQQRATGNFYMMRDEKYEKIGTLDLTRESALP